MWIGKVEVAWIAMARPVATGEEAVKQGARAECLEDIFESQSRGTFDGLRTALGIVTYVIHPFHIISFLCNLIHSH